MHQTHPYLSAAEQAAPLIGVFLLLLLLLLLLAAVPLPAGTHLRRHHEPTGSDGDGDNYENLAIPLAVAVATFAKRKTHTNRAEDEDSRCLRQVVVAARDRRERGGKQPWKNNPPRVKLTRRVFPRLIYKASFRCSTSTYTQSSDRRC